MMKRILQILFVITMILTVSQLSKAANVPEVQIDDPPMETPPDITGFTYSDGWWDINPTPATYVSVRSPGFTGYTNAGFRLNAQVITDFNVYSGYSYEDCMWERNMRLAKMSIPELIAQSGNYDTPSGSFAWYDFPLDWGGGVFQLSAVVSVGSCPLPQPILPSEPVIIDDGYFGASALRYDYDGTVYGVFKYRHMHSHENGSCPAFCGRSVDDVVAVAVTDFHNPGDRIRLIVPFGFGICSPVYVVHENASELICFDISNN